MASADPDVFEGEATVIVEDSVSFTDTQFLQLAFKGDVARVTLSADPSSALARWLAAHDQARILMRLELSPEPERLSR